MTVKRSNGEDHKRLRLMALLASLATFAIALLAAWEFVVSAENGIGGGWPGFHLEALVPWIGAGGDGIVQINYHVGVDGVSLWLFLLFNGCSFWVYVWSRFRLRCLLLRSVRLKGLLQ